MKKRLLVLAVSLLIMLAANLPAKAASVTFTDWVKFSGSGAGTPILSVTIDDGGTPGSVTITMHATSLLSSEKITEWYFNVTLGIGTDPVHFSGQKGSVVAGSNAYKADGDGYYDIFFTFPTSGETAGDNGTFGNDETSVWTLTFEGLTANHFLSESTPGGQGVGTFYSAVKLGNAYWAPETVTTVPEPATFSLLAVGLLLGMAVRKRLK